MNRAVLHLLAAGVSLCAFSAAAIAAPLDLENARHSAPPPPGMQAAEAATSEPMHVASAQRGNMGGGFIEFLFSGNDNAPPQQYQQPQYQQPAPVMMPPAADPRMEQPEAEENYQHQGYAPPQYPRNAAIAPVPVEPARPVRPAINPRFLPQVVNYTGAEKPGTIIIDTRIKHLFLIEPGGKAMRYGVGVGKPGFLWAGIKTVSRKREWPDWTPPAEMLQRRPDLPRHMEGGPENPLGARALYLGSTLYRIHGSNEPWTIGTNVSSGCIRMRNQDVIDLYSRVPVGTKVVVL